MSEKTHLADILYSDKAVVRISCAFTAHILFAVLLASGCKPLRVVCTRPPQQVYWRCEGSPPPPGHLWPLQWKFRNPAVAGGVWVHDLEVPRTATSAKDLCAH